MKGGGDGRGRRARTGQADWTLGNRLPFRSARSPSGQKKKKHHLRRPHRRACGSVPCPKVRARLLHCSAAGAHLADRGTTERLSAGEGRAPAKGATKQRPRDRRGTEGGEKARIDMPSDPEPCSRTTKESERKERRDVSKGRAMVYCNIGISAHGTSISRLLQSRSFVSPGGLSRAIGAALLGANGQPAAGFELRPGPMYRPAGARWPDFLACIDQHGQPLGKPSGLRSWPMMFFG